MTGTCVRVVVISLCTCLLVGCGNGSTPTAPSQAAVSPLPAGPYLLNIFSVVAQSQCSGGSASIPVLTADVAMSVESGTPVQARASNSGDLSLRFTARGGPSIGIAPLDGSATGSASAVPGNISSVVGLRLDEGRLQGFATPSSASGEVTGRVVYRTTDGNEVTCASARWGLVPNQP